ncbi:Protein of unknown function [Bacillus wiedmannii]|nr:Protein of unknown function [Bacillus wiedmannii]
MEFWFELLKEIAR